MPIIPPGVPAVRTVAIGGPAGPQGAPGQSAIQRVASQAMTAGQVVRTHAAGQQMQPAITDLRTRPFDAILLGDIGSGATGNFHVAGPVPANILQLGAGAACAVGVDVSGRPVRATDPTCVSAPNWVGTCDALGNVTVNPRRSDFLNVLDFGASADGLTFCDDAFDAAIASASFGDTIFLPAGTYRTSRTFGPFPRGVSVTGVGASHFIDHIGSVIAYEGLGDGVRHSRTIDANETVQGSISNILIRCKTSGIPGVYNQAPQRQSPSIQVGGGVASCVSAGGLIKVFTNVAHGLNTGNLVAIAGVTGTTEANSGWQITVTDAFSFTLDGSTFSHAYVGGGTVTMRCGAGLCGIGTGQFTWENVYVSGFGVGFMLDAAENGVMRRCSSDGYAGQSDIGTNSKRFSCAVWLTDGDSGASGWTVSGSTNVNTIDDVNFQGCRIGIQIDGCASVTINRPRTGNLGGAGLLNKTVTGAVSAGGLIRLTCVAHGLFTGDFAGVVGVGGVPAATGEWQVTKVDDDHIDLQGSTFAGSYTTGGVVSGYCPATIARINRSSGLIIEGSYSEGAGDAHYLFEKQTESSSSNSNQVVTIRNATAIGGCPAIKIIAVAVEELNIFACFWITTQAQGGNLVTGNHVRVGNRVGNGFMTPGQEFWDLPTSTVSELISEYNVNLP